MNGEILIAHAQQRLAQRCVSTTDLEWALRLGREVEGGFLILKKDAEAAARELERLAEHVRRLSGLRIVASAGTLVTAYRAGNRKQRHLLRNAEARNVKGLRDV